MSTSREYWHNHFEEWQSSGLTQKAYCLENELKLTTFKGWLKEFRRGKRGGNFVAVGTGMILEIRVGALTIRVPQGFDGVELKRVVEALSC